VINVHIYHNRLISVVFLSIRTISYFSNQVSHENYIEKDDVGNDDRDDVGMMETILGMMVEIML
jgi:hypothetical protein